MFYISPKINQFELLKDQSKTSTQLVDEMEERFYAQDVTMTMIGLREADSHNIIEFRTYDAMFDTINSALYEMCVAAGIDEEIEEILNDDDDGYGWNFPASILPFIKQLIYKAIEAHDIRAPEDM